MWEKVLKASAIFTVFALLQIFGAQKSFAVGTILNTSDTITTSRPSASAPLNANVSAGATNASVVDNGSIYLASDSATFQADTGETLDTGVNIGTMSAQIAGTPNTRTLYFTNTVGHSHHAGDAVYVPITAMHTISFKLTTSIPSGGKIILTFPGSGSNAASPSASTFAFNGLTSSNISYQLVSGGAVTCTSIAVSAPSITCTTTGGSLASGQVVTFLIGCADGSTNETACTSQQPRLINPTKSTTNICNNNATTCTADIWKISVTTQDASGNNLDTGSMKIGTNESVQVSATVEPSLSYFISGLTNNTNLNTITNCPSETTNAGIDATATNVSLGTLANGQINIAGQKISVSTNGSSGYVITATSSGRFIDVDTGYWLPDANGGNGLTANNTPAPAVFGASGTPDFGINACGDNVPAQWSGASTTGFSTGAKYANPWNSGTNDYYMTITSATGAVSNDVTGLRYAATIGSTTAAGKYLTTLTYVVTATF